MPVKHGKGGSGNKNGPKDPAMAERDRGPATLTMRESRLLDKKRELMGNVDSGQDGMLLGRNKVLNEDENMDLDHTMLRMDKVLMGNVNSGESHTPLGSARNEVLTETGNLVQNDALRSNEVFTENGNSGQDDMLLGSSQDTVNSGHNIDDAWTERMSASPGLDDALFGNSEDAVDSGQNGTLMENTSPGFDDAPLRRSGRGGLSKKVVATWGTIDNRAVNLDDEEITMEAESTEIDQPQLQAQPIAAVTEHRPKPSPSIPSLLLPAQETLRYLIETQIQAGVPLSDDGIIHHHSALPSHQVKDTKIDKDYTSDSRSTPGSTSPSLSSHSPTHPPRKIYSPVDFYQLCRYAFFVSQEFDCSLGATPTTTHTISYPPNPSSPSEGVPLHLFTIRSILSSPSTEESILTTLIKVSYLALSTTTSHPAELLEFYDSLLITAWATLGTHPSALSAFNPFSVGQGFVRDLPSILDRFWARNDFKDKLVSQLSASEGWGKEWCAKVHSLIWKENQVLEGTGAQWQVRVLWTVEVLQAMKEFAGKGMGVEKVWRVLLTKRRDRGSWKGFAASVEGASVFVVGKQDLDGLYVD